MPRDVYAAFEEILQLSSLSSFLAIWQSRLLVQYKRLLYIGFRGLSAMCMGSKLSILGMPHSYLQLCSPICETSQCSKSSLVRERPNSMAHKITSCSWDQAPAIISLCCLSVQVYDWAHVVFWLQAIHNTLILASRFHVFCLMPSVQI